jgi:tetratricopeptide (TPR) repeat protein
VQESPGADRLARGREYLRNDEAKRAVREFQAAIKADPNLAEAHVGAVRAWLRLGDLKKALTAAEEGAGACPRSPAALTALADAHLATGNGSAAKAAADGALALPRPPSGAWRAKAEAVALLDLEGAAAGEKVLREALAAAPKEGALHVALGGFLLDRGRTKEAIPHIRKSIEAFPRSVEHRVQLIRLLLIEKDIQGARDVALEAKGMAPDDPEVCVALGRTYEEGGEPVAALPHYQQAAKLRPRKASYHVNVGYCQAMLRSWKQAQKTLVTAVKLDGTNIEARLHLGWVYNRLGRGPLRPHRQVQGRRQVPRTAAAPRAQPLRGPPAAGPLGLQGRARGRRLGAPGGLPGHGREEHPRAVPAGAAPRRRRR